MATDEFSNSNQFFSELYEYDWYSGKHENHHIFVKNVYRRRVNFCRDIAISSMVSGHKNFLKLVGCCLETELPAMVYHGIKKHCKFDIKELSWKRRMKIAEDIATALAYLHTAFPRPFVYRNRSLENILLDDDGVAKLWDFSYCISIPQGEKSVKVDRLRGLYGYLEDSYVSSGVVSEKTDTFATGILMQKLLTGEERFRELFVEEEEEEGEDERGFIYDDYDTLWERNIPNWLSKSMEERKMDAMADPKILKEMGENSEEELCRMKAFLLLSQRCIGLRGEVPTMVEVAKELKKIQRSLLLLQVKPNLTIPETFLP